MKSRLISMLRQPSTSGFTLQDIAVILAFVGLVAVILYPVFGRG